MHRTFGTTTLRQQTYLDGAWDFMADPQDKGLGEGWYSHYPSDALKMWVPGVWNTLRAYLNYEGVAWLRTKLALRQCAAAVVHFAAVTHQANVWVDGEPLGEHYGGFTPFSFVLTQPEPGEHELVVRIDNTHNLQNTIPSSNLDWFRYGGIPRPVWVEELQGPGYIASLRLTPVVSDTQCTLRVRTELLNLSGQILDETWTLYIEGQPIRSAQVHLEPADAQVLLFAVDLPGAQLWSPSDPRLYRVRLAFAGDDLVDRTGFREIRVAGRQVLLNGTPLRLAGVNRHEDHPDWGFALPPHLMLRDLELIGDLGANTIRGAHYPNDQRMLDLCDERGLLFMEEIPLWGYAREQLALDIISDRAAAMLWAMLDRDINHPCIWAWSVLNECATDTPEGRGVVERLIETAHDADPTRPITYASDRNTQDICYDLADVVCVNAYYGWYLHDQTWPKFLDRILAKIGDKPLVVTEFGAGAIYGCHALEDGVMWSEEYQRKLLADCIRHFRAREDLVGFYIWQLFDMRTDGGPHALGRPRNYNNKGLLDEYRRPKMAYYAVRELLTQRSTCVSEADTP
jgi:beta-glucuronidase